MQTVRPIFDFSTQETTLTMSGQIADDGKVISHATDFLPSHPSDQT